MTRSLAIAAVAFASFAFATPANAADCGTINAKIEGVATTTKVISAGPSCNTAKKVAKKAIATVFAGSIRVDGNIWRAGWPLSSSNTFRITYGRGDNAVRLTTTYH